MGGGGWGGGVGGDGRGGLEKVNLFYYESKFKIKKWRVGGGGPV